MRSCTLIACLAFLCLRLSPGLAQDPATPPAKADTLPFGPVDAYERQTNFMEIRKRLPGEILGSNKRDRAIGECQLNLQTTRLLSDGEQQLKALWQLRQKTNDIFIDIKAAAARQAELGDRIATAMADRGIAQQTYNQLKQDNAQLQSLGQRQINQEKQLNAFIQDIKQAVKNVPPPPSFTTRSGIGMQLLGKGRDAFYVSATPITTQQFLAVNQGLPANSTPAPDADNKTPRQGSITFAQAEEFCRNLSAFERLNYALPDAKQQSILSQESYAPGCALWINNHWNPNDLDATRLNDRFAMSFFVIWDPQQCLANGVLFGELPFASSPQLGLAVVTGQETGWLLRWQRILIEMSNTTLSPIIDTQPAPEQ